MDYLFYDLNRSYNKNESTIDSEYHNIYIKTASEFKSKNNIPIYPQENNHVLNFENVPIKN